MRCSASPPTWKIAGSVPHEWASLRQVQSSLALLGPVPEPAGPAVADSRGGEPGASAQPAEASFQGWNLAWKNTVGPFLLQASAGFASAVLLLGTVIVLVSMFAQPEIGAGQQGRTAWKSHGASPGESLKRCGQQSDRQPFPARWWWKPISMARVEMYDYRIVSGPNDDATQARRLRTCF